MIEEYDIRCLESPDDATWTAVGGGIRDHNQQQAGDAAHKWVCCIVTAPDQHIGGGLIGEIYWNWLNIELVWVQEDLRGRGLGTRLLKLAEDEARRLGATNVHLDTFSFQAPEFYLQQGYRVFGKLSDFPPGHTRYWLTKQL